MWEKRRGDYRRVRVGTTHISENSLPEQWNLIQEELRKYKGIIIIRKTLEDLDYKHMSTCELCLQSERWIFFFFNGGKDPISMERSQLLQKANERKTCIKLCILLISLFGWINVFYPLVLFVKF